MNNKTYYESNILVLLLSAVICLLFYIYIIQVKNKNDHAITVVGNKVSVTFWHNVDKKNYLR